MKKLEQSRTVMVDVDDSIILWFPEQYQHLPENLIIIEGNGQQIAFLPHFKNIEFIKRLKLQGYGIVIWSASGPDWCEKIVKALNIENIPDVIMGKPELSIDDLLDAKKILKQIIWIDPVTGEYKRSE